MSLDPIKTLRELVAIPSVNPMGFPRQGPEYGESRLSDYLERLFGGMGMTCWREQIHPGRDNVTARLDGDPSSDGRLILFEAHQDTVPVDGMTIEPWEPLLRDGRLHGRGACDIKGGMAAMLAALARLAEERPAGMPTIVMACTVNEEHGFTGATALAPRLAAEGDEIFTRRPEAAIVAEPTELDVVVAHKGAIRWRCHTVGKAGHSSRPEAAVNAVYRMARVLSALERYQEQTLPDLGSHPLCGRSTLSVGTIQGGTSVNTVPDRCTIEIDRRLRPGELPEAAYQHAVDHIAKEAGLDFPVTMDEPNLRVLPLLDDANGPLADRLVEIIHGVTGRRRKIGVPYSTDAPCYASTGISTVVFGPGSIDQAHTADEWVSVEQVRQAAEVFYRFAAAGV